MKHLLALAFCIASLSLLAQATPVPADSLVQHAVECLLEQVPAGQDVALDVQAAEWTGQLQQFLTQGLLGRGQTVRTEPAPGMLLVQVRYDRTSQQKGSNSLLGRTLREETTHRFRLQVVDAGSQSVQSVACCELMTTQKLTDELQTMRWYDPVLISAILGGLIYLFYYGSE